MEKQFVTYEIALKLKELGFNKECLAYYNNPPYPDLMHNCENVMESNFIIENIGNSLKAPLWQQVIDWLREKQNICIDIEPITFDDEPTYIFEIINLKNGMLLNNINSSFIDSSEALEQAILEALELIAQNRTK